MMVLSLNLLLIKADCVPVLVFGQEQLAQRTLKHANFAYQSNRNTSLSAKEQQELAGLDNKIIFLTAQLAIVTGADKAQTTTDLRRATDRRDELRDPNVGTGPLAVLKRELELAYAVSELADATEFVTRVQAHSDGLPV